MSKKVLTEQELELLASVLTEFENQTRRDTYVFRISGGYARAEMEYYDNDYIYISLTWGVSNESGSDKHFEEWKLKRSYLSLEKKELVPENMASYIAHKIEEA